MTINTLLPFARNVMKPAINNTVFPISTTKSLAMSIFNFFRRNHSSVNNLGVDTAIAEPMTKVDRSLFVEEEAPELKNAAKKMINPIEVILEQNFDWQGYNDGYSHPETEYLENMLSLIRSEFRLAVDKCIDIRRAEIGELRLHQIQTSGISNRLEAQLAEKIKQLEALIHELDTQKILSVENEGMVAPAVYAYRIGFIRGLEQYQQEKLFAGSTGLFNQ